jgi:glycosyltransferase involved in cell wall biosynthesis
MTMATARYRWYERKNGISVLIATQNEEAIVALCLLSFLEFGDELIVVDNGSTDRTKEIVRDLESMYARKIKFFDVPDLPDLYHNRQYAFCKSSYRWVARVDADFVAYTDGEYNILHVRERLLSQKRSFWPGVFGVWLPNVVGDFWHTGLEQPAGGVGPNDPGRYVPPPVSLPTLRIYEVFPGFKFKRLGRGEGTTFNRMLRAIRTDLDRPLWMHCNLKAARNYLFRSERTNWRELGDYTRYPTLESYVREVIKHKYGTEDIDKATQLHLQRNVSPFLQRYDPEKYYPYPRLVREQMERNCLYKITKHNDTVRWEHFGIDPLPYV